jgi:hypothetical protein
MLIIVFNSLLTYFYEKIVMWYVTLWWRKRVEKKKEVKRKRIVDESVKMYEAGGVTSRHSGNKSLLLKFNS